MTVKEWLFVWFKAARAPFLVVSIIPSFVGGIIAYLHGQFDPAIFAIVTIGIVMAHSAADFIDDYFDFKTGNLGNKEKQFHDSPLIDGKVTLKQVAIATALCLVISFASGIYLLIEIGMPVLIMAAIGTFIVFFYTSPPVRLNYHGLGESALFFAFGPMIVFGVYYVLTKEFSLEPIMASIPLGIFTMNVGLVSNTFDYEDDVQSGKKAIPVIFGQAFAAKLLVIVTIIAYLSLIGAVLFRIMPYWTLISLITVPIAFQVNSATLKYQDTSNYTKAMTKTIALSSVMGILLFASYVIVIASSD